MRIVNYCYILLGYFTICENFNFINSAFVLMRVFGNVQFA